MAQLHKTVILWAEQSNGCGADQFGKSFPKLHKIKQVLCNSSAVDKI